MVKTIIFPVIYIVIGIFTTSFAQIILKIGSGYEVFKFKWILFLFFSAFSYLISFICYSFALKYFEISKISPIMMACTVTIVIIYGIFFNGETMNFNKMLGTLFAIGAVILLARS